MNGPDGYLSVSKSDRLKPTVDAEFAREANPLGKRLLLFIRKAKNAKKMGTRILSIPISFQEFNHFLLMILRYRRVKCRLFAFGKFKGSMRRPMRFACRYFIFAFEIEKVTR